MQHLADLGSRGVRHSGVVLDLVGDVDLPARPAPLQKEDGGGERKYRDSGHFAQGSNDKQLGPLWENRHAEGSRGGGRPFEPGAESFRGRQYGARDDKSGGSSE